MEESILKSTKRILNIAQGDTAFDLDVATHINAAFSTLCQLGVGPEDGFFIMDETALWGDFVVPANQLHMVKSYIYLKVRLLFDPPTTSFAIEAADRQLREFEWRLNGMREVLLVDSAPPPDFILDGGGP